MPIATLVYRFDASLIFFNADYFANRVRQVIAESKEKPTTFVLDAEAISLLDTTGADVLAALHFELQRDGIVMSIARGKGWLE